MSQAQWDKVERYLIESLVPADPALQAALKATEAAGLPAIEVAPPHGKLLHILARMCGAKRILEIGTLGGYSTIWLARALPKGGKLVSLELQPRNAEVAKANIQRAGLGEMVEIRVGPAIDTLATLDGPFDFVFIDADKPSYPQYLDAVVDRLGDPGLIVVDNTLWSGDVVDPPDEGHAAAVAAFNDKVMRDPRLVSTVLTVRDGVTLIRRA